MKSRDTTLDVAKGILILLVVIGHSQFQFKSYIYWFHMPAFFIISGILFRPGADYINLAKRLFIPYLAFSIINIAIIYFYVPRFHSGNGVLDLAARHLYSGKVIGGVFWFLPVLFLTRAFYEVITALTNLNATRIIVLFIYIISHVVSSVFMPDINYTRLSFSQTMPWNADVVLISLMYFHIGREISLLSERTTIKHKIGVVSFLMCIFIITLSISGHFKYTLDLKYSHYRSVIFDLIIPVCFFVTTLYLSKKISTSAFANYISFAGRNSIYIMFLHLPANVIASNYFDYGIMTFLIIGMSAPVFFSVISNSNAVTRKLFTGS